MGVELAGEIIDRYSDKNVSLIHSGTTLVTTNFGEKFSKRINRHLTESCNVNVILGTVKYEHHMHIKNNISNGILLIFIRNLIQSQCFF